MPKPIRETPTRDYVLELVRKLPGLSCRQLFESGQHTNGLSEHSINSALSHMFSVDQTVWRMRLGFTVSGAFLQSLGFEPVKVKAANLFHEADFEKICMAIVSHVLEVCEVEHA